MNGLGYLCGRCFTKLRIKTCLELFCSRLPIRNLCFGVFAQVCEHASFYRSWTDVLDDLEILTYAGLCKERWGEPEFPKPHKSERVLCCSTFG